MLKHAPLGSIIASETCFLELVHDASKLAAEFHPSRQRVCHPWRRWIGGPNVRRATAGRGGGRVRLSDSARRCRFLEAGMQDTTMSTDLDYNCVLWPRLSLRRSSRSSRRRSRDCKLSSMRHVLHSPPASTRLGRIADKQSRARCSAVGGALNVLRLVQQPMRQRRSSAPRAGHFM
jgi:hypothetical protein